MEERTSLEALRSLGFDSGNPEILNITEDYKFKSSYAEIFFRVYEKACGIKIPGLFTDGGSFSGQSNILCFYPLETVNLPSEKRSAGRLKKANLCAASFLQFIDSLANNQLDFYFADTEIFKKSQISDGKIFTGYGGFDTIILPPCEIPSGLEKILFDCGRQNITVITANLNEFSDAVNRISQTENLIAARSVREIPYAAIAAKTPLILAKSDIPAVCLTRVGENGFAVFIFNSGGEKEAVFEFSPDSPENFGMITVTEIKTGAEYEPDELQISNAKISMKLYFNEYSVMRVDFKKR